MFFVVNVEAAILKDGRYLLVIRGEEEEHAAGTLALVGGKVEANGAMGEVLEATVRREIKEEVCLEVGELAYVQSSSFVADDGTPVVDVVFLCCYKAGEAEIGDPGEVGEILWLDAEDVMQHPKAPEWTRRSIENCEKLRQELGW